MVSVCVLSYNHEKYLRQCLDGIFMQEVSFPIEVRVHDDASTDRSQEIINEYQQRYPDILKPILQSENQYSKGGGILNKFLLPLCEGKYIALCEGDDYWTDPLKLQKQVDFLESHEDFSMCFHAARISLEGVGASAIGAVCENIENREYSSTEVFERWIVPTASIVFRQSDIKDFVVKHAEWLTRGDICQVLKCAHVGKIFGMKDCMSVYRMQPSSVSHSAEYRGKEVYDLPNHFRCIYYNFPKVDKAPIKWNISHAYYSRMKAEKGIVRKVRDFVLFLCWDPRWAFQKITHLARKR